MLITQSLMFTGVVKPDKSNLLTLRLTVQIYNAKKPLSRVFVKYFY